MKNGGGGDGSIMGADATKRSSIAMVVDTSEDGAGGKKGGKFG